MSVLRWGIMTRKLKFKHVCILWNAQKFQKYQLHTIIIATSDPVRVMIEYMQRNLLIETCYSFSEVIDIHSSVSLMIPSFFCLTGHNLSSTFWELTQNSNIDSTSKYSTVHIRSLRKVFYKFLLMCLKFNFIEARTNVNCTFVFEYL